MIQPKSNLDINHMEGWSRIEEVVFLFILCSVVNLLMAIISYIPITYSIKDMVRVFLFIEGILFVFFVTGVLLVLACGGSI